MQNKKSQVAPQRESGPPLQEAVRTSFVELKSFAADLRSIVLAAHKLPAVVVPPARVWRFLRTQLEREGILRPSMRGRLEEHTRFPMFKNHTVERKQLGDS
jgi:hypothetical protein